MPADVPISNERRTQVAKQLLQLAANEAAAVPALLARLPSPLSSFNEWVPTYDQVSTNISKLILFAEGQGCFAILEGALEDLRQPAQHAAQVNALQNANQVAITRELKDALAGALQQFATGDTEDLKNSMKRALGGDEVVNRVAWLKPIAEVAYAVVDETESEGMLAKLVAAFHREKPGNRALNQFVLHYFPMLYRDPILDRTSAAWATSRTAFDAILVARRTPFINRAIVRQYLTKLFQNPHGVANILTVNGPSRVGKSYLSQLVDFLVEVGTHGNPETQPHTRGEHRYALLRPLHRGALHSVREVVSEMLSQLGWKDLMPEQYKSEDGWGQEVIFNFRNRLTNSDDVVWIIADKYWDFANPRAIIDFFVGLAREAHLQQGRNKLRLILIDFPPEPLDDFIQNHGSDAQFQRLNLDWLTPDDVEKFCETFARSQPPGSVVASALFAAIRQHVDEGLTGAALQASWCSALKQELSPYW